MPRRKQNKQSLVRRTAGTAVDVAVGGAALATDKALGVVEDAIHKAEDALSDHSDGRAYEDRTRDELYQLAVEREIEGRSSMSKDELIFALRADR